MEDEERDTVPDLASEDLFSDETFKKVLAAKKSNATQFESYWEHDENDIDTWTKVRHRNVNFLFLLTLFVC